MNDRPRRIPISDNLAVALGTACSRLTGFVRLVTLAYVLIPAAAPGVHADGRLSDVYNLANTAPNIIYDLVLGGALTATLVPRFTRAIAENDRRAIDAIVSLSLVALAALAALATLAAPLIIRVYTSFSSTAVASQYDRVATSLAYVFLPQILFYGATTVFSALLNAQGRFFAAAWAPVLTNLVTIAGLLYVAAAYDNVTIEHVASNSTLRFVIGIGETLGVAAMAFALVPAVFRSGTRPRFAPDLHHPAVREVVKLSTWTLGYVVANQVALLVITVIALRQFSDFSAYTSMYLLLQLPHGLLAVTLMTTYTPRLTRAHVAGNAVLFRTLVRAGVRVLVGLLLPAAAMFVAAPGAASALAGNFADLGSSPGVLRGFGVGLVAFSVYLFLLRGFYAMQDTRTPFMLNLVQNGCNVALAIPFGLHWHAAGLAWAFSISYIVAAVFTWTKLDRAVRGGLRLELLAPGVARALVAVVPMAIAAWAIDGALDPSGMAEGVLTLVVAGVLGGACYFATLGALGGMRPRPALPARRR